MTSATSIPEYESQLNGLVRKNREDCPPYEVARQLLADDRSGHMAVFDRPGPGGSGVVSQETRRLQAQRFSPEAEDNPYDAFAREIMIHYHLPPSVGRGRIASTTAFAYR